MTYENKIAPAQSGGREHNPGLDLLRCVSMCGIVVLHVLGKGGVLYGTTPFSWGYVGSWFLEALALCAVNCYGLISGYCGVESRFAYKKYLPRWLQVAFYSVGIAALYAALGLAPFDWKSALFPVLHTQYWYFSAYTVVFFFMPYLNKLLHALDEGEARRLCRTVIILFSALPTLFVTDPFNVGFGYTAIWLIALYLIGGCLRRFGVKRLLPPWGSFGVYLLAVLGGWGGMLLLKYGPFLATGALPPAGDSLLWYISPFMLLAALALLFCFQQMKLKNRALLKAIRLLAPVSFGVYLIHNHPLVAQYPMTGFLKPALALPAPAYLVIALGAALGIYLACSLVDGVRLLLFRAVGGLIKRPGKEKPPK